ncbi:MAG: beta-ketoacyl synthase [Geobacter sp.]|nr:MAG: beta-ketoacyl synthase [Geobacter sp.]
MEEGKPEIPAGAAPLAIIGIGCLFPGAEDQNTYWANIREGVDAITDIPSTHWRTADYHDPDPKTADHTYGQRGGFISPFPFNPLEFNIPPNTLEAIDTSQLLGLVAAGQALKDAGYGPEKEYDRNRVSVILGVTGSLELVIPLGARLGHPIWKKAMKEAGIDDTVAEDAAKRISDSYVSWQENSFPGLLGNVVAGRISKQYDLSGTNCVVDAACASSLSALHLASMELDAGKADMVVTGGIDTFNDIFMYMCFSKTPALSPTGDAKPFDAGADGTILGEGLGIVVIKRLADAERDGDKIYAVIRGIGSSSDGKGDAIYAPSAAGQKKALLNAYRQADVTPESIELIEAHGTGTKVGDVVEVKALRQVYGEADRPWCALGTVKSQIGHTKAAAGAAGLIKVALALHHKVIPPTIKVKKPLDEVTSGPTPFYINTEKRPWIPRAGGPRRGAVSAFGFGGSNFHTVLEEYQPKMVSVDWDGNTQVIPFSGADIPALETALATITADIPWNELRGRAAAARAAFDGNAPCRLALVVERDRTNLAGLCTNALAMLRKNTAERWNTPDGACFSRTKPGKLGMVFPGQGAQYAGMLRDLACSFPQMIDSLTAADDGLMFPDDMRLSDLIYPIQAFDPAARNRQEEALRATEAAQPAIGAVSLGALRILESFGITAEAVAGHSYGELTALCAGGRLDETALHALSRLRGRLMGAGSGDKGGMLAIPAPLATVEQILAEEKLELVIANRNAPAQAILSGSSAEIDRAATIFAARKLTCKRLPVAAAFHSPLVADAATPFLAALADFDLSPGNMPVYANTTGAPYPADQAAAKELLAGQLARPVEFVAEIEAMYAAGIRTFVEVGPGARLTGLIDAILGEQDHIALALDASSGKRSGMVDLARTLAQLSVLGYGVRLKAWDEAYRPAAPSTTKKPAMTIPLCGANYVQPKPARPPVAPKPTVATVSSAPQAAAPAAAVSTVAAPSAIPVVPQGMLAESLRVTRESMALLQKMQEETAMLHRRFLEGQETAGRTFQTLLDNQRQILAGGGNIAPVAPFASCRTTAVPTPAVETSTPPAPVSAAVRPPVTMPAAPPQAPANRVAETLLAVVSEKTGYPVEMLDLDMGMDADLGIDSIKRVEILSTLQERLPGAPVIGPEHLGTLRTLGEIARHLGAGTTPQAGAVAPSVAPAAANNVAETLLAVVSEKTGYPVEMLDLDMGMDADLGIDSIKRVEILSTLQERLPGAPVIGPEHLGTLRTLGEIARHLGAGIAPQASTPVAPSVAEKSAPAEQSKPAASAHPVVRSTIIPIPLDSEDSAPLSPASGELWVTDDGSTLTAELCTILRDRGFTPKLISTRELPKITPASLSGLVITAPFQGTDDLFLEEAFLLLQSAAPALRQGGTTGGAIFTTISRLDGAFGTTSGGQLADPLSGGLAGLSKTAGHEWPEVACKALDLGQFADPAAAARAIADELFRSGPVEVGLTPEGRITLSLTELPAAPIPAALPVSRGDLIVVTGGGRGVTAAAAAALAEACQPVLLILGRSPAPTEEPEWLRNLTEEPRIKRAILEQAGGKLHPREIEERFRTVISGRELSSTVGRIEAAGGKALYRSVDIRDGAAVNATIEEIRREYGPVRGIVHGAGVLADRLITDKSREQFSAVYGTKVDGLRALLAATRNDDLRFIALFSSSTGRFGRTGQVDYAVANEVLNKLAQAEMRHLPACRTVSINWGPWDGGMVTPALKKVFAGEGISLIGLAEGVDFLVREIAATDGPVEVVALASAPEELAASHPPVRSQDLTEALSLTLTVDDYPFLRSHVLDGKAVLPMAVIVEWLAHGALHGNPGFRLRGFNDLRICKGVVFDQSTPCTIQLLAGRAVKRESSYLVPVELHSIGKGGQPVLNARAEIVLAMRLTEGIRSIIEIPATPYILHNGKLYDRERLFHGPDLHGIEQVDGCSAKGIAAAVKVAPPPSSWMKHPIRSTWLTDPLVIDSAFQLMILWSFERFGAGSLPCFAGRYRQFQETFPEEGVQVVIRVTAEREHGATADMEFLDRNSGKLIARLEGYECVIDPSLERAFQRNQLPQAGCVERGAA